MPVILPERSWAAWLDPAGAGRGGADAAATAFPVRRHAGLPGPAAREQPEARRAGVPGIGVGGGPGGRWQRGRQASRRAAVRGAVGLGPSAWPLPPTTRLATQHGARPGLPGSQGLAPLRWGLRFSLRINVGPTLRTPPAWGGTGLQRLFRSRPAGPAERHHAPPLPAQDRGGHAPREGDLHRKGFASAQAIGGAIIRAEGRVAPCQAGGCSAARPSAGPPAQETTALVLMPCNNPPSRRRAVVRGEGRIRGGGPPSGCGR